ncbi:MAG: replication-relaxation family protein [Candidatus Thiodiazotropha sp. (ex Troendleina suluensis)]|nr:replication-relaxation family protein [Candidatus Thiodiazotropha sp. (ex Troendleina suluensis)]
MNEKPTHDRMGRRYRDKPVSTGKRITPTDRDILLFDKIHRHGPLPTKYLVAYSKLIRKSTTRAKDRLTDLFNEDNTPHDGTYLSRPWQQFETLDARQHDLVYDLTPRSKCLLKEQGLWSEYTPNTSGSWKHTFMTSCITASIELGTHENEFTRYIFQDEILSRSGSKLSFSVDVLGINKRLIPDGLFGLEYTCDGKQYYRFFLVEADRATEPGRTQNFSRKSYRRTILQYREFVGKGLYKEALGLSATLLVLNVTTSELRHRNLLELTKELSGSSGNNYLLFQYAPELGRYFHPPDILFHLFMNGWERGGWGPFSISTVSGT